MEIGSARNLTQNIQCKNKSLAKDSRNVSAADDFREPKLGKLQPVVKNRELCVKETNTKKHEHNDQR